MAVNWREALNYLGKYIDIAFIPIFIWILSDPIWKRYAANGFLLSMGLVLILSLGLFTGIVPGIYFLRLHQSNPVVFKLSITHNYSWRYWCCSPSVMRSKPHSHEPNGFG